MTPMDLHSLLTSLEAIERVCTHETAKLESSKKASHKGKKGKKRPGTKSMARVPRKFVSRRIVTCARGMGAHTPCTIPGIVVDMRKTEKRNSISMPLRKAVRTTIP
jgi:hypothetical protein